MITIGAKKNAEKRRDFFCSECIFKCSKKSEWDRHISTRKHKMITNDYKMITKNHEKTPKLYTCECGNVYSHRQGLYKHRQKCPIIHAKVQENVQFVQSTPVQESMNEEKVVKLVTNTVTSAITAVVPAIMNGNKEMIVDVVKEVVKKDTTTNNNSHNTTNNNTFNLQLFLNEDCKNAMNITDFVKNLQINTTDFEQVGQLGYSEGISRLLIKGLSELDITRRPIHCSDIKREVIHIKDQNKWEKDTPNRDRLKDVIKQIGNKSMMLMDDYVKENPGCKEPQHNKNDLYLKCMIQSIGPVHDDTTYDRELKKISRKVATYTIINK